MSNMSYSLLLPIKGKDAVTSILFASDSVGHVSAMANTELLERKEDVIRVKLIQAERLLDNEIDEKETIEYMLAEAKH
jgi:hypothetical protein